MSDPEGFLQQDPGQEDYLKQIVGGPEAMQKAPEIGGFATDHAIEVQDQSANAEPITVHSDREASASPFATTNANYDPNQVLKT